MYSTLKDVIAAVNNSSGNKSDAIISNLDGDSGRRAARAISIFGSGLGLDRHEVSLSCASQS